MRRISVLEILLATALAFTMVYLHSAKRKNSSLQKSLSALEEKSKKAFAGSQRLQLVAEANAGLREMLISHQERQIGLLKTAARIDAERIEALNATISSMEYVAEGYARTVVELCPNLKSITQELSQDNRRPASSP